MTNAAELALENVLHGEVRGGPDFHIKNIGMTIGTIKPLIVRFVGEKDGRHHHPTGLKLQRFIKNNRLGLIIHKAPFGLDGILLEGCHPVDPVAEWGLGETIQRFKLLNASGSIVIVALIALIFPGMPESGLAIVATLSPAKLALQVLFLGNFRGVQTHLKAKFKMTHLAGMPYAVRPVGKSHGLLPVLLGQAVYQNIAILSGRGQWRELPIGRGHGRKAKQSGT